MSEIYNSCLPDKWKSVTSDKMKTIVTPQIVRQIISLLHEEMARISNETTCQALPPFIPRDQCNSDPPPAGCQTWYSDVPYDNCVNGNNLWSYKDTALSICLIIILYVKGKSCMRIATGNPYGKLRGMDI